jgi:hypothetical protein
MAIDPQNVPGEFIVKNLHSGLFHEYLAVQKNTQLGYDYDLATFFEPVTNYIIKRLTIDAMVGFSTVGGDSAGSYNKTILAAVEEVESGGSHGALEPTYPTVSTIYTPSSALSYLLPGAHNLFAINAFSTGFYERVSINLDFDSETFMWKKNAKLYFSSISTYPTAIGAILGNYTIVLVRPPTGYHYNDAGEIIAGEET